MPRQLLSLQVSQCFCTFSTGSGKRQTHFEKGRIRRLYRKMSLVFQGADNPHGPLPIKAS